MELIFDIIADLILKLLGKVTEQTKSATVQTFVDVLVAAAFLVAVDGCAIWCAVSFYRKGNMLLAVMLAFAAVIFFLLVGFMILRRIIRRRKS